MSVGDAGYSGQHKHGLQSGRAASGDHLMKTKLDGLPPRKIAKTGSSFRGHLLLTFADGAELTLERSQYDVANPPKVGEYFPAMPVPAEEPTVESLFGSGQDASAHDAVENQPVAGDVAQQAAAPSADDGGADSDAPAGEKA